MATINIRRDVKDPFYRYKMPRLQGKVEGKGNGIKTVLPNIIDVSRALSRPPAYATKYFGSELGAQVHIEEKLEKYIVNGSHEVSKLQDLLDGFIDKFVLCGKCKSPETDLSISKDQCIIRKCMACGQTSDVDMRHKLATYIIKNPPPKDKKGGQHASATANGSGEADISGPTGDSVDDGMAQLMGDISLSNGAVIAEAANDNEDWDDGWDEDIDVSSEAVAKRQKALAGGFSLGASADGDDDEAANGDGETDSYDVLGDFIKSSKTIADDEIFAKAKELGLDKKHRVLAVIVQCLFDPPSSAIGKDIRSHAKLLRKFGNSDKHQRSIIGGFERVIESNQEKLLSKTPTILNVLYDADIVEEEAFLEWGKKPSKKYVEKATAKKIHQAAQPFLQWLEEAEEESE